MYLLRIFITAILFLSANLYGVSALHEPLFRKATPAGFVYYYRAFKVPANFKPSSADLKHEARKGWNDLVWQYDNYDNMRVGTYNMPKMVAAMYDPDTSTMTVASSVVSARQGPGPGPPPGARIGYHPGQLPQQVTALLAQAAHDGRWPTDHRTGGSCAEIACLATYFSNNPNKPYAALGRVRFLAYGFGGGTVARVQNPCDGGADQRGCINFLDVLNIRWCGPAAQGADRISKRDDTPSANASASDLGYSQVPDDQDPLLCHVPNAPSNIPSGVNVDTMTTIPESTTVVSINGPDSSIPGSWVDVGTETAAPDATPIPPDVSPDPNEGPDTTGGPTTTASPTTAPPPTSVAPPPTTLTMSTSPGIPLVAPSSLIGNQEEETNDCINQCVSGFNSCGASSPPSTGPKEKVKRGWSQILGRRGSGLDCNAFATCYQTQAPYKSGTTTIDTSQIAGVCGASCEQIETSNGLDTLFNCLEPVEAGA